MKRYRIYQEKEWWFITYDRRKKLFREITEREFNEARFKHFERARRYNGVDFIDTCKERLLKIEEYKKIPYIYIGTGTEDYLKYQCPSADLKKYYTLCPGERCNGDYIEDKLLVNYFVKKWIKHFIAVGRGWALNLNGKALMQYL